jgi:uncharacterized Ntn-hydrolase superfamily protein
VTFSIVARSADRRMFGVAIASSSPAVAARCAHARAGAGAVTTQNITDPALGPRILSTLAQGGRADAALDEAVRSTPFGAYRQLTVIAAEGAPAVHSGAHTLARCAAAVGADAAAAGNLLADADVPALMLAAFEAADGHLGARLLSALRAGLDGGGEAGPIHSAGLLIVREVAWPIVDLRVDWNQDDPIRALAAVWDIYAPQIDDYVRRALDPRTAPSFGEAEGPA